MEVALPVALIYSGVGPMSLAFALIGLVAIPIFWLSLRPLRRTVDGR